VIVMPLSQMGGDLQPWRAYPRRSMVDDVDRRERFAYALREALRIRKMSQGQLAERIGRAEGTVRRWAAGQTLPSVLEIAPLADALGVEYRYFVKPPEPQPYPVREFLREVTASAEEAGQGRSDHSDQAPPPEAPRTKGRRRSRRLRDSDPEQQQ